MRTYINFKKQSMYLSEDDFETLFGIDYFEKEFDYFFMGSWEAVNFYFQRILGMKLHLSDKPIYDAHNSAEDDRWYDELEQYIQDHMPNNFHGSFEVLNYHISNLLEITITKKEQDQEIDKTDYPAWAIE